METKIKQLTDIIGDKSVSTDQEKLLAYSTDYSFTPRRSPRVIAKASSADEVQKIVEWANKESVPLVPISSGPPHFRGDTVPGVGGAVMVDLSGMKKVIRIDSKNRMAIVEPGITYTELQPMLIKENLRLATPLLPRSNKSVVASVLEREATLIPKYRWMLSDPLRCLEVVWGNGHRMMTGEAGIFNSLESAWKRYMVQLKPFGPAQVDYYKFLQAAQGSMGIVTWTALRCERLPKVQKLLLIPAKNLTDLIDFTYRLLRLRFGDELLILNSTDLAYILNTDKEKIKSHMNTLPSWVLLVNICGRDMLPEEKVEFVEKDIRDIAQQFGLKIMDAIDGFRSEEVIELLQNPSPEPYWKLRYKNSCQDIFFLTTLDRSAEFVATVYSIAQSRGYATSDIGTYIQPVQQGTSCHCEFNFPYNPADVAETAKLQELFFAISTEVLNKGAYFSRPYSIWADMMYNRNAQGTNLLKMVKHMFDPNNIMNPGKLCF